MAFLGAARRVAAAKTSAATRGIAAAATSAERPASPFLEPLHGKVAVSPYLVGAPPWQRPCPEVPGSWWPMGAVLAEPGIPPYTAAGLATSSSRRSGYALEGVLRRSSQSRGSGAAAPGSVTNSQRGFLALRREKLNTRLFMERPLEADYTISVDSRGRPVVLGVGMSGPVREARCRRDQQRCAIKSFQKSRLDEQQMCMLLNEAQIFLEVDHPSIVRLLGCYEDKEELHFVMECCRGGELANMLHRQQRLREEEVADILRQMFKVLLYLHNNRIVHRDLKLENWMFEDASPCARIKLIDFGLSCIWGPEDAQGMQRRCGTRYCMAPEMLENQHYCHKIDLWALGIVAFSLLTGRCPLAAESEFSSTTALASFTHQLFTEQVSKHSGSGEAFRLPEASMDCVSSGARDFVAQLLTPDPADRMGPSQALAHPWLQQCCGCAGGTTLRREMARVDGAMVRGWKRFVSFSPAMRVLLVEFAISSRLAEGSIDGLQELFAEQSRHGGTMCRTDFERLLLQSGQEVQCNEASALFAAITSAGRGKCPRGWATEQLGYSEFLAAALPSRFDATQLLSELFRMLDRDRDGLVASTEFLAALSGTSVTETEARACLDTVGIRSGGFLTLRDFALALQG